MYHVTDIRRHAAAALLAGACLAGVPTLAAAQTSGVLRATPYIGFIIFGDYVEGPVGTRITNDGSVLFGATLGLDMAPNISLVGNLGYTQSDVRVRIPVVGGVSIANSTILFYDAGLQYRFANSMAASGGIVPFVEAGVGGMRYEVTTGPLATNSTNFAANFGGGLEYGVSRNLMLRGSVKDYVGKFDFREATAFSLDSRVAHHFAFTAGLTLRF